MPHCGSLILGVHHNSVPTAQLNGGVIAVLDVSPNVYVCVSHHLPPRSGLCGQIVRAVGVFCDLSP